LTNGDAAPTAYFDHDETPDVETYPGQPSAEGDDAPSSWDGTAEETLPVSEDENPTLWGDSTDDIPQDLGGTGESSTSPPTPQAPTAETTPEDFKLRLKTPSLETYAPSVPLEAVRYLIA